MSFDRDMDSVLLPTRSRHEPNLVRDCVGMRKKINEMLDTLTKNRI